MQIDPRVLIELLQRLEHQEALHRPALADTAKAIDRNRYKDAIEATESLRGILESLEITRQRLATQVVPADRLGEPESIAELAIRTRRLVVGMQVPRLKDALKEPRAKERSRSWCVGKYQRPDDVIDFLSSIASGSTLWEEYKAGRRQAYEMHDEDRQILYRAAVRCVQRALLQHGKSSDLSHFLKSGVEALELSDIQVCCQQLSAALSSELETPSDGWATPHCNPPLLRAVPDLP